MPRSVTEIPGNEDLTLLTAMMKKNDFFGFPAYVAKIDGKIVGIAVVQLGYYPAFAKVWCLEVAKHYQKMGIGRPRGISRSTQPRAFNNSAVESCPAGSKATISGLKKHCTNTLRMISTIARLVLSASLPPFSTQALPDFKQSENTSSVTFGRAS